MNKLLILSFILIFSFNTKASPIEHKCGTAIKKVLKKWKSKGRWNKVVSSKGVWAYRSPTQSFGKWIELHTNNSDVYIQLISDNAIESSRVENKKCNVVNERFPFQIVRKDAPKKNLFQSSDLKALMKNGSPGLVVIWSPQQIYSVQHYDLYSKVAERFKLPVTYLMSPHAPEKVLQAVNSVAGKKLEDRRMASVELAMRGGAIHTPTAFVYGWNKISPTIVGVMDESTLSNHVLLHLGELSK